MGFEQDLLTPGFIKEVIIGSKLNHYVHRTKHGPDAYSDKDKFPNGPWCKKKDWVLFARYAGSRIYIDGGEIRVLNDDEILGTIEDPEDILHALTV